MNPVANEPTDDGSSVIATVIFEMPAVTSYDNRAIFGSALTQKIVYPHKRVGMQRQLATTQA